jgi:hypothetical protein
MTRLLRRRYDVIIKSQNFGSESSCNDKLLSAANVLKMHDVLLGSFLSDFIKNNMKNLLHHGVGDYM